jgi:hypothetical protein
MGIRELRILLGLISSHKPESATSAPRKMGRSVALAGRSGAQATWRPEKVQWFRCEPLTRVGRQQARDLLGDQIVTAQRFSL